MEPVSGNGGTPWSVLGEFLGGIVVGAMAVAASVLAWLRRRSSDEGSDERTRAGMRSQDGCKFDGERMTTRLERVEEKIVQLLERMESQREAASAETRAIMARQTEILAGIAAELRARR